MRPMSRRELLERGLHIAVLWALAVAQPLFDLLGRNPEFFATRGSPPGDIVAFALLVTFAVPLAVLVLEWLAGLIGEGVAWTVHLVCVAVLVGAIVLQATSLAGTVPALVVALALGAAAALAYVRLPAARTFLTVLGPAPLFRRQARHRAQLVIRSPDRSAAIVAVREAVETVAALREHAGASFAVDVDPQ